MVGLYGRLLGFRACRLEAFVRGGSISGGWGFLVGLGHRSGVELSNQSDSPDTRLTTCEDDVAAYGGRRTCP